MDNEAIERSMDQSAANVLAHGGVVVVIGGDRLSTEIGALADNPRVVVWDEDVMKTRPSIPSNARLVVLTRYLSHANSNRIHEECNRKKIRILRMTHISPGAAAKRLEAILNNGKPVETPVPPSTETVTVSHPVEPTKPVKDKPRTISPRGAIKNFVMKYCPTDKTPIEAFQYLWPMIKQAYPKTTEASVKNTIREYLKKGFRQHVTKPVPVFVPTPPAKPTPSESKSGDFVLKLLDDAIAAMQLAREEYQKGMARIEEQTKLKQRLEQLLKE